MSRTTSKKIQKQKALKKAERQKKQVVKNMLAGKTCTKCAYYDPYRECCINSKRFTINKRPLVIPKEETCFSWEKDNKPWSILNKLVSVSPMAKPTGSIFYIKPVYSGGKKT
jgi:hypothetical protein